MRLRVFRAADAAKAIALVRAEMGPDALILGTRRITEGVEVTAALDPVAEGEPCAASASPPTSDAGRAAEADATADALCAWHGVPPALAAALRRLPLPDALAARLRFGALPLGPASPPLLVAGPPGAGKTLSVARLATRLVLAGQSVVVITADARRAGASEQLGALVRLLGLTLVEATDVVTLTLAVRRRAAEGQVLIDLPGSDAHAARERDELEALAAATAATVVTVLPAGLDAAEAADLATGYRAAGADFLIATRLDLARRLGGVLAAAGVGLALAEAGIGPGAADGLVPMTPELLAQRMERAIHPDHGEPTA